jgi:molybdopterin synthase catalytic subunit
MKLYLCLLFPGDEVLIDIIKSKIHTDILFSNLSDPACGAIVTFEGRVRNHNDGKKIINLHYECYESMALKVMNEIKEEALKKWDVKKIIAIHRIGNIPIGETAVWIGVLSVHRKEAFSACEFMINEIKHKVPIWKKETYEDGSTSWVDCCEVVSSTK